MTGRVPPRLNSHKNRWARFNVLFSLRLNLSTLNLISHCRTPTPRARANYLTFWSLYISAARHQFRVWKRAGYSHWLLQGVEYYTVSGSVWCQWTFTPCHEEKAMYPFIQWTMSTDDRRVVECLKRDLNGLWVMQSIKRRSHAVPDIPSGCGMCRLYYTRDLSMVRRMAQVTAGRSILHQITIVFIRTFPARFRTFARNKIV